MHDANKFQPFTLDMVSHQLHRVFDMTTPQSLDAVVKVLRRIKAPEQAQLLRKKLGLMDRNPTMVQTGQQLYNTVFLHNWRMLPIQFGLPSASQVLAELIRVAGFEAILYRSTKGSGRCLAVFPDLLDSASFVALVDPPPAEVQHRRLDENSAGSLTGWETLAPRYKPR